jgi:hypothetical protein
MIISIIDTFKELVEIIGTQVMCFTYIFLVLVLISVLILLSPAIFFFSIKNKIENNHNKIYNKNYVLNELD